MTHSGLRMALANRPKSAEQEGVPINAAIRAREIDRAHVKSRAGDANLESSGAAGVIRIDLT